MHHSAFETAGQGGLSAIAEEFRELDGRRRRRGLSLKEAAHYWFLYSRLSDALVSLDTPELDGRQFLRVEFRMDIAMERPAGELVAACKDFGAGGCLIRSAARLKRGEEVVIDAAVIEGVRHPLRVGAVVSWTHVDSGTHALGAERDYGLRFSIDCPATRDAIERVFYRALDAFLTAPPRPSA